MIAAAGPVRLDFNDYILYTETHPDHAFELIDGAIYTLAPEGGLHARTRSALDLNRFTPYTEISFRAGIGLTVPNRQSRSARTVNSQRPDR